MNTFPILLKREFWENRGGFLRAPSAVAIFFVAVTLMAWVWAEATMGRTGIKVDNLPLEQIAANISAEHMEQVGDVFNGALVVFGTVVQTVLGVVLFFYLLGALYDDRRDRSILFWKSMPISDTATVLSKVVSAAVVAPVIAFAITVVLHVSMLILVSLMLAVHGVNPIKFVWAPSSPIAIWLHMFATIPLHALWALPTIGWLLLVSSFARSKPILWALLPPIGVGLALNWLEAMREFKVPSTWYWQHVFGRGLGSMMPGSWGSDGKSLHFGLNISRRQDVLDLFSWQTLGNAATNPDLWIGAVVGAAMIALAVHLRRTRELAD